VVEWYDPIVELARAAASNFQNPQWLWGIPIAFIVLLILIRWSPVRISYDPDASRRLRRLRVTVFLLRFIAVTLVLIALATPVTTITKESAGDPRALILIDKSASMDAYDMSTVAYLTEKIGDQLPTTVSEFGSPTQSPIGDAVLGHPEHILIISDGNANTGVDIRDVAQIARSNNVSLNAIDLNPTTEDAAVVVDVPAQVPLGFPAGIVVTVTSTALQPVPLTVTIDGQQVYSGTVIGAVPLDPVLSTGYHRIEARIGQGGTHAGNDAHFRVLEVLEKPKILILTKGAGPLEAALGKSFDATVATSLPSDLSPYTAVVINDVHASRVGSSTVLAEFLKDEQGGAYGNGLVVIGGFNSYDRGAYGNTQLESLLPVKVGKAKRNLGDNNLVFVIQISGSTGDTRYVAGAGGALVEVKDDISTLDVIKAQSVSAINSLNLRNNVGVVVFGVSTAGQSFDNPQDALEASVVRLADVKTLASNKQDIVSTEKGIPALRGGGTTAPAIALEEAIQMLQTKTGGKTIIFLSNGRFAAGLGDTGAGAKADVEAKLQKARRLGIGVHMIGVGSTDSDPAAFAKKVDEGFMVAAAERTDGLYDRATSLARLTVNYGDPDEKGFGEDFSLVTMSLTHFITRGLELDVVLNGYNEVAPKDGSRMLVATDGGQPALVTWNYFNGRVASLTTFTASGLGPLLSGKNSDLVRNTVLWAIGDPARKADVVIRVPTATVGEKSEITFISKEPISGNCADTPLSFVRSSGDSYVFSFTPTQIGFGTACGVPYAVNEQSERWRVGESASLSEAVRMTGGDVFTFDQVDQIVERIRTVSTRVTVERTELRNPFVALAIIVFLLEIFIRRLTKVSG